MSHNVTISGVSIEDFDVLKAALAELNKDNGTNFELEVGEVASRNYGGFGPETRVIKDTVAVIRCKGMSYDITLTKGKDGKIAMQTEALMIDPLLRALKVPDTVANVKTGEDAKLGSNVGYRRNEDLGMRGALGPIMQRYSLIAAERQAQRRGNRVTRQHNPATGVITLTVAVR